MPADIFTQSILEMSGTPVEAAAAVCSWGSISVNRMLTAAAVLLVVADISDMFDLLPHIKDCISRARGNISLEHSVGIARSRNLAALILALPFSLIADRFQLFRPGFWSAFPAWMSAPATLLFLLAAALLMYLMTVFIRLPRMDSESRDALHNSSYTYFIVLCTIALVSIGILYVTGASDETTRTVLLWETALVYAFSILRAGQILAASYALLPTILYLCALKIVIPGLLVVTAMLF